ncbi:MAG: hypothetical protein RL148_1158 [Planctomycetota bacterium]
MKICLSCEGISATEHDQCGHCGAALLSMDAVHFPLRRGEADAANPLLGALLDGKYRIQGVLGRGGMGTVFRAVHEVSLVPVAVKLLHPRFGMRPELRRALVAEARRAGRVVDEHCARILDVGETEDGTVYLAMELAAGETLDLWLRGGKGLQPAVAVAILVQVCRALVAIHGAGLVHRDLSLRNVMVSVRDGKPFVKVLDFGIAKATLSGRSGDREHEGAPFANPVFSAPEHLSGSPADARADLYGLGVLAHCMLTGELPVRATDPREAAAATAQGRIEPLPAVPGVPRSLHRLVQQCLSLDPSRRPVSAELVLRQLEALVRADHSALRGWSLATLGAALVAAALAWADGAAPFLESTPGSPLVVVPGPVVRDSVPRILRSEDLATVSFAYGGFPADRLQVELARGGAGLSQVDLTPFVDRDHARLVLSMGQQEWRAAVAGIAGESVAGPVDVRFLVPGIAALGSARLRIDDQPPEAAIACEASGASATALTAATRVVVRVQDAVGVSRCTLQLRGDGVEFDLELPVEPSRTVSGTDLLAAIPGPQPGGPVSLAVHAVDHAGNETITQPLHFETCDLAVPVVEEWVGMQGEQDVWHLGGRAEFRLRTSATEPGLGFLARDPLGGTRPVEAVAAAPGSNWWNCRMSGPVDRSAVAFPVGRWSVELVDPAGNRSTAEFSPVFRDRDLAPRWSVVGDDPAVVSGEDIVLSPEGCTLDLQVLPSHTVAAVALRTRDGASVEPGAGVDLLQSGRGSGRMRVRGLQEGNWQLLVTVQPAAGVGGGQVEFRRGLVVLPRTLVVRVPSPSGRFLPALLQDGTFVLQDGRLRPGPGWTCDGGMGMHMRGELLSGGADLVPQALVPVAEVFPGTATFPLVPGRNLVAARLRDVLGREVRVLRGNELAPTAVVGGVRVHLLADFVNADQPPELVGGELLVEHGEPARLRLRVRPALLGNELDSAVLALGQGEFRPVAAESVVDGMELVFQLPRDVWVRAATVDPQVQGVATLADASPAEFARGIRASVRGVYTSPAGRSELLLPVRTVRSTLRALPLGDLVPALPEPLAALRFVPVLAPEGPWPDPLPADAPARGSFHAGPPTDVRNLEDVFVLDAEVTQAQYLALLRAWEARAQPVGAEGARLVHATDPLGESRTTAAAMVPSAFAGDLDAFIAEAASRPDRAVHGVDFHQAWCWTRMLGALVGRTPGWFRLPLGCELDLAAFGNMPPGVARQGAAAHGRSVAASAFRSGAPADDARAAALASGDVVDGPWPAPVHGLDFGVREWTCDLPVPAGPEHLLLQEWVGDARLHLRRVEEHAAGELSSTMLPARVAALGVVRGTAFGEPRLMVDPATGLRAVDVDGRLAPTVPGVTRAEHLRRDGRDVVPGALDRRLDAVGFRVVGGAAFVRHARSLR